MVYPKGWTTFITPVIPIYSINEKLCTNTRMTTLQRKGLWYYIIQTAGVPEHAPHQGAACQAHLEPDFWSHNGICCATSSMPTCVFCLIFQLYNPYFYNINFPLWIYWFEKNKNVPDADSYWRSHRE